MNARNDTFSINRTSRLNFLNPETKRSNSAKIDRMPPPIYSERRRSNSTKSPRSETFADENPDEQIMPEVDNAFYEEHKVGCAWRKARSQSKSRYHDSNTFLVHPKPWGARNPSDIPCFCKGSNYGTRLSRSPTRIKDLRSTHDKEMSKAKMNDVVASLCTLFERKKLKVNEYEIELFFDLLKEKIKKYKDGNYNKDHRVPKQEGKIDNIPQARKTKTVQNLSPSLPSGQGEHPSGIQQQPVVGKVESKKYYIELKAEDEVPPGLKQMLGMMNPHCPEKQYVLMDGGVPSEGVPQYTVMNAGVLRHHEENTMVLLGNQSIQSPMTRPKQVPLTLSSANINRGRRP